MRKPDFERLEKVLFLDGEPDYIPFYELFADQEIMEIVVEGSLKRAEPRTKDYFKTMIKFYFKLGYDYVPLSVPSLLTRDNRIPADDTAERPHQKRVWQDENRGVIETREDFENYPWPELDAIQETYLPMYEFVRKNLPEGMMIIGGTSGGVLENVMWLMGAVPFFKCLFRDPALIRDMFERIGRILVFSCKLAAELDMVGAVVMGDDMGYKSGPMMALERFRKYVFPWQKQCVDAVHKHGKPFILHSCGNLKILMEDLINHVGIDAKHSYEDTSYPVIQYKRDYGHRIAILGGVDMDKLSRMSEREFRSYVKNIIRECAPGGGYALGCGNSVANYVKLENYLLMLEIGRKYGKYPLKM